MRMWKEVTFASALTLATAFSLTPSEGHEFKLGQIEIVHPWARQPPAAAKVMGGFMKITNTGTDDDRLIKATAEITPEVQLHEMKMEGDVMKMAELPDGIPVPAGKTVELKPGSLHVMFMDLKSQPKKGEMIKGTLVFEKAGTVAIEYSVEAPNAGMDMK